MTRKVLSIPLLFLGIFWLVPLDAGTVFLKNKYIIQGRVSEVDDTKVVISWNNGSVTLYRQFIEDYILDPSEEEFFREQAREAELEEEIGVIPELDEPDELDLPTSLSEIISMHDENLVESGGGSTPTPPVTHNPSTGTVPEMNPIPRLPANKDETVFPEVGVALVAPTGWVVIRKPGSLRIQKDDSAPNPSLTVQVSPAGGPTADIAREEFQKALVDSYPDIQIVGEHEEQIGFQRARVVVGDLPAANVHFRQILVSYRDTHYLIGVQLVRPVDSEDLRTLEQALHSFRFLEL